MQRGLLKFVGGVVVMASLATAVLGGYRAVAALTQHGYSGEGVSPPDFVLEPMNHSPSVQHGSGLPGDGEGEEKSGMGDAENAKCSPGDWFAVRTCKEDGLHQCDYVCTENGEGWKWQGCGVVIVAPECEHDEWCYRHGDEYEWGCWDIIPGNKTPVDDFTGDSSGWVFSPGDGTNVVDFNREGTLLLANEGNSPQFPLVGRNDFFDEIDGYWRLSIRFRFPEVTDYETGIAVGTAPFTTDRQSHPYPHRTEWEDVLSIYQFSRYWTILGYGTIHYHVKGGDTGWHTIELEVAHNSFYTLRLDGAKIGVGDTHGRVPRSLWFGSYFTQPQGGNWTDVQVDWVRIEADQDPPVTSIVWGGTKGRYGWYLSAVPAFPSASDTWSGVANMQYRIDDGDWQPCHKQYRGAFVVSAEGRHTVEVRSIDNAGNVEAAQSQTVKIDTAPPETTLTIVCSTSSTGDQCLGPVGLSFRASDTASGVDITEYRVDGGPWRAAVPSATIAGEGVHVVEYRSIDVAGNKEDVKSVRVRIASALSTVTE